MTRTDFQRPASIVLMFALAAMAVRFPFEGFWVVAGLVVLGAVQWRVPHAWLYACPVILACINLMPWTGWISFDVMDLFVGVTLAVELLRRHQIEGAPLRRFSLLFLGLFGVSMIVSAAVSLWPFAPPTINSFFDYLDPYNALRILRGLIWASVAIWLARRAMAVGIDVPTHFLRGIAVAVIVVAAVALRERFVYADIFPFLRAYRVIGPFASMHIGGSHIGAFLVLALPVSFMLMLLDRSATGRLLGIVALMTGGITLLLTFSRAAWLGTGISILVFIAHYSLTHRKQSTQFVVLERMTMVFVFGVIFYVTAIVAEAGYLQQRVANIPKDFQYRLVLSSDAINMMDDGWRPRLVGMGLGSFPRLYYNRNKQGVQASRRGIVAENGNRYLRNISGKNGQIASQETLFSVGQQLSLKPDQPYILSFRAKSPTETGVQLEIKEKTVLNHRYGIALPLPRSFTKDWRRYEVQFNSKFLGKRPLVKRRSHTLLLFNKAPNSIIDIDDIQLVDRAGRNLIRNGDFSGGHDHWTFEVQNHVAYQVKNTFVGVFFEQGILGLLSFTLLFFSAIVAFRHLPAHIACLSGLLGFSAFSFFDNVLVSPRLLMLFLFYWAIICMLPSQAGDTATRSEQAE